MAALCQDGVSRDIVVMHPQSCYEEDDDLLSSFIFLMKKGGRDKLSAHILSRSSFSHEVQSVERIATTMRQAAVTRTAVWLLVLLVSNECVTVSNAIKERLQMNENAHVIGTMKKFMEDDFGLDHLDESSFLEVDLAAKHGMTMEEYQTYEIKSVHDAFREEWAFKNSPVFLEVQALENIPDGKILSQKEILKHQSINSALLEKAVQKIMGGHGPQIVPGRCKSVAKGFAGGFRRAFGHCDNNAQCKADGSIHVWDHIKRGARRFGSATGIQSLQKLTDTGPCLGECGCDRVR